MLDMTRLFTKKPRREDFFLDLRSSLEHTIRSSPRSRAHDANQLCTNEVERRPIVGRVATR